MAKSTKKALAAALKQMMEIKPIDRITIRDLVEICGVNRQTFYYHFDDVYDLLEWVFEEDANANLPQEVIYDNWKQDVLQWFSYLRANSTFALNVYNSNNRHYMLRYIKGRLKECIKSFAALASRGKNIDRQDFEFVVDMYVSMVVGVIAQWMDDGMSVPEAYTADMLLKFLDGSVEQLLERFEK